MQKPLKYDHVALIATALFVCIAAVGILASLIIAIGMIHGIFLRRSFEAMLAIAWYSVGLKLAWDTFSYGWDTAKLPERCAATWRNQFWFNATSWTLIVGFCLVQKRSNLYRSIMETFSDPLNNPDNVLILGAWGGALTGLAAAAWWRARRAATRSGQSAPVD